MPVKPRWMARFPAFASPRCRDLPGSIDRTTDRKRPRVTGPQIDGHILFGAFNQVAFKRRLRWLEPGPLTYRPDTDPTPTNPASTRGLTDAESQLRQGVSGLPGTAYPDGLHNGLH